MAFDEAVFKCLSKHAVFTRRARPQAPCAQESGRAGRSDPPKKAFAAFGSRRRGQKVESKKLI